MQLPKISIITVCYNSQQTLQDTIDSVASQEYPNIEYIIIDGNSIDGVHKIIENNKDKINIFISEADTGIYHAMNKGLKYASGDIIGILNSNDFFYNNNVIKNIVEHFKITDADVVYGDLIYIQNNKSKKPVRYWKSSNFNRSNLKFGWSPPHPTFYCKRNVYEKSGFFKLNYKISSDYDFMLRVLKDKDFKIVYLPRIFINMRTGGVSNKTIHNIIKKSVEDYIIIKKNKIGGFPTLVFKNIRKIKQFLLKSYIK